MNRRSFLHFTTLLLGTPLFSWIPVRKPKIISITADGTPMRIYTTAHEQACKYEFDQGIKEICAKLKKELYGT